MTGNCYQTGNKRSIGDISDYCEDFGSENLYVANMETKPSYLYLREWLAELRIKQTELASRIGRSRAAINRYCKPEEQQRLHPELLQDIANALGIRVTALWHHPREFPPGELKTMVRPPIVKTKKPKRRHNGDSSAE